MASFLDRFTSSPTQEAVARATSDMQMAPDWALNLELVDLANTDAATAKEVLKGARKRLNHKDERVQMLTIVLLETLYKNSSDVCREQMSLKENMSELSKLAVGKKAPIAVRLQLLALIESWTRDSASNPRLVGFREAHRAMQSQNAPFPNEAILPSASEYFEGGADGGALAIAPLEAPAQQATRPNNSNATPAINPVTRQPNQRPSNPFARRPTAYGVLNEDLLSNEAENRTNQEGGTHYPNQYPEGGNRNRTNRPNRANPEYALTDSNSNSSNSSSYAPPDLSYTQAHALAHANSLHSGSAGPRAADHSHGMAMIAPVVEVDVPVLSSSAASL